MKVRSNKTGSNIRICSVAEKSVGFQNWRTRSFRVTTGMQQKGRCPREHSTGNTCVWLELHPIQRVHLNSPQVPFATLIKISLIISSQSLKKQKKNSFTHQQAVVFRFKMPLQTHRKRCSCVSYHSTVPTSFRGKEWSHLAGVALSSFPTPPPAQGSAERTCTSPHTPGPSHSLQNHQALSSWASSLFIQLRFCALRGVYFIQSTPCTEPGTWEALNKRLLDKMDGWVYG